MQPIWKDYHVTLGVDDAIDFQITANGEVIYTGRSVKRPGQAVNAVRINDICADYLVNTLPSLSEDALSAMQFPVVFGVRTLVDGEWDTIDEQEFMNDWSYDYDYNPETMGLSFPINGRMDVRQWIVSTAYKSSTITATIRLKSGVSFDVYVPVRISDDFNGDFNYDFSQSVRMAQNQTAVFDLSRWQDVESVTIGNNVFKVVNGCSRYALYYVNAYGGWDSLLIEGNHSEVDNLTRWTREVEYDNRSVQNRGKINYVNEIVKSLTLHTSWLSDDESSRMHHLLNSTNVYLGDLVTGQMIPVILTDTRTDYKTYKGNGGRLVNYAINVTIAQERIRR